MAASRVLSDEDLFALRWVSGVAMRPDGAEAVYVESWVDRAKNAYRSRLMRVSADGAVQPFSMGEEDEQPAYRPDGREVAFLSRRGGGAKQVWAMPIDGGEAHQVTRVEGGVAAFAYSPDGGRMALIANLDAEGVVAERDEAERRRRDEADPQRRFTRGVKVITELFHKMDGLGYYGERRPQVALLERVPGAGEPPAADGQTIRQLTWGPYGAADLSWAPDGGSLLFLSRRDADYDRHSFDRLLYRLDLGRAGAAPECLTPDGRLAVGTARAAPDGRRVALLASDPDALGYDNQALYLLEPDGSLRRLAESLDRPFGDLGLSDVMAGGYAGLTWLADGKTLLALLSDRGRTHLVAVDTVLDSVRTVAGGDRRVCGYGAASDGHAVALVTTDPTTPSRLSWWIGPEGRERTVAEPSAAALNGVRLSTPRPFTARAAGGPELDGWIMEPAEGGPGPWPTVLEIHGGPMLMYAWAFFFEFQLLAARGYAVVYGNPRGSQGYGEAFCRAIRKEWGDLDHADLMAILDTALAVEGRLDGGRLAVMGGSYGGYMTNWIIGHTDRFRAAVTMRSVVDWRAMVGSGDGGADWIRRAGKAPWEDDAWYRSQSPITYVANIVTPLLIEHQEGDLRCPIEQGEILYTAVRHLGRAPVKFVRYPEEFHGMSRSGKPWHRVHRLRMALDWLDRFVLGRPADPALRSPAELLRETVPPASGPTPSA